MLEHKITISFKDQSVFQVFQVSLTSLHQLKSDGNTLIFQVLLTTIIYLSISSNFLVSTDTDGYPNLLMLMALLI